MKQVRSTRPVESATRGKLEGFKQQAAELMRVNEGPATQGTLAYDWFLSR